MLPHFVYLAPLVRLVHLDRSLHWEGPVDFLGVALTGIVRRWVRALLVLILVLASLRVDGSDKLWKYTVISSVKSRK